MITASQGAMRSLPMKLESLLSGPEHGLRAEEEKKLRILQGDLQRLIDNYLLEPSEVVSPASTANSWMGGVRDLSYDMDDFIYELAHVSRGGGARINVVQKEKLPRIKISRFPEKRRRRQWITDEISAVRTRVNEAIRRHREYLGSNCRWRPSSSGQPPPPSPSSGEAANHLVGLDSSIKQLCGWLADDGQPGHKVASILGAGGVGKTTLAKQVYHMLGGQFECLAFVRTPRKPDMKGLLTSILSQVRPQQLPYGACDVHNLVLNISAHLQHKTYLIVIEDLWVLSTWDLVNRSLPKGNRCSRILTTTEVEVIAQACCADNSKCTPAKKEDNSMCIINKEPLSEDESRELFLSRAFAKQAECSQHLKEVSGEIIKASGGLPLAINILASLLARQPAGSIEQWSYIKNSLISSAFTTNAASLDRINQVLNLAYDNLPHSLKACMLYLCLYEEDCVIWKGDLVKQWIAEDFICAVEGEEVARSYFYELVNRGMIQPVDINCNGEILSCRVHPMVLQFIRDKSMEENFCIAIDHSQTTTRLADKVRRLALHLGNVEDATPPGQSMRLSKVRSVAFSGLLKCMPSIAEFRFLQVLILKLLVDPDKMSDSLTASDGLSLSGNITEPDNLTKQDDVSYNLTEISELFRLRYFLLDACHMSVVLPTQMRQLKNLVAWEIYAQVTAVPSDIVDLPGLLYLSIPSEAHLPTGIGCMTSLRTLGVVDLSKNSTETVMSLCELTNLQDLHLTCSTLQPDNLENNLECMGSIVQKLWNLKHVTLVPSLSSPVNTQDGADTLSMSISWLGLSIQPLPPALLLQTLELSRRCCIFSSLPEWIKELTKLCILKIAVRKLPSEDVAILKGLPSLTALSLFVWTAPATRIVFDDEGFSVLKYFKFVCATPCMEFQQGALPQVRKLKLGFNVNRVNGYSLDAAGFRHLTGLNEISIKIGGTDVPEDNRRSTQSVLTTAIANHPSTPITNVQWVDWNFCGDDEKYIHEDGFQEKNSEGDAKKKQADIRTYMPSESTLDLETTEMEQSVDQLRGEGGKDDFIMQWAMNTLDQQQYQAAVFPNPLAYGGAGSGGCRSAFDGAAFPSLQALRQSTAAVDGDRDLTVQVHHQQPSSLSTNSSDNPSAIMDHDVAAAGAGWSPHTHTASAMGMTGISSSRPIWNFSAATTSAQPPAAARRGHNSTPTAGRTSGGSAQSTAASSESKVVQDTIIAERRRREKLNAHFVALSAIVPSVKKCTYVRDKASILGEAVKYVRELEEKVKTLEETARAAAAATTRSAVLVNKKIKPDNDEVGGPIHGGGGGLPEIEVRVWGEKNVLVQIHCENVRGLLVRVLAEVEDLGLAITHTTSVMPFPDPTVIIAITAKVEEGFNSTVEEIVKRLNLSLAPTLRRQ